jgi:hypothetical protein
MLPFTVAVHVLQDEYKDSPGSVITAGGFRQCSCSGVKQLVSVICSWYGATFAMLAMQLLKAPG